MYLLVEIKKCLPAIIAERHSKGYWHIKLFSLSFKRTVRSKCGLMISLSTGMILPGYLYRYQEVFPGELNGGGFF
jgi:hypothetical protein